MKRNFEYFCKDYENIENYEKALADNFKGWQCHHRMGAELSRKELKALDMYYNRPAEELIFLTISEHTSLHKKGKHLSEEVRMNVAAAARATHKGNKYNLGKHHSEETKNKIGTASIGKHWYNNGKENRFCFECPEGFVIGMLKRK